MALGSGIAWIIAHGGHTVDVERCTTVTDDLGDVDRTYAVVSAGLGAWVQPLDSYTIQQYRRRDIQITHRVYFAADPGVQLRDRIVQTGRYLLVEAIEDTAELDKLWCVDCTETQ